MSLRIRSRFRRRLCLWSFVCNLNSFLIYICVWSLSHREITRINLSYTMNAMSLLILRQFETWSLSSTPTTCHFVSVLFSFQTTFVVKVRWTHFESLWSVERKSLSRLPMNVLVELDLRFCAAFLSVTNADFEIGH